MFKNAKLKLLMKLSGFEKLGTEDKADTTWTVPSALTSTHLDELHRTIENSLTNPWTDANDRDPEDLLRRIKPSATTSATAHSETDSPPRNAFPSDSEGSDHLSDFMFPDNVRSRTNNQGQDAATAKKNPKKRKLIRHADKENDDPLADEERRNAREQAALARRRKIKSELYIRDSDEEMDEDENRAFFAREEVNRLRQAERVRVAMAVGRGEGGGAEERGRRKKRRRLASEEEEVEEEEVEEEEEQEEDGEQEKDMDIMMDMTTGPESDASRPKRAVNNTSDDDELDIDDTTPLSSQSQASLPTTPIITTATATTMKGLAKDLALREIPQPTTAFHALTTTTTTTTTTATVPKGQIVEEESDDELAPVVMPSQRRRVRAGFVLDDSDED